MFLAWTRAVAAQGSAEPPASEDPKPTETAAAQGAAEPSLEQLQRSFLESKEPNVGLAIARRLVEQGRWLEAAAFYLEVQNLEEPSGAPSGDEGTEPRALAKVEREQLLAKTPAVVITVESDAADEVRVFLNGARVERRELGQKRLVDPGSVRVEGVLDGTRVETALELGPGETKPVRLVFQPKRAKVARAAPIGRPTPAVDPDSDRGAGARMVAYLTMGVGGATMLTGGLFGVLALRDEASLKSRCPDDVCPPALKPDVDAYTQKKRITTIALASGAGLALAGGVLYLTAGSPSERKAAPRVGAFCDGTQAGIWGAF